MKSVGTIYKSIKKNQKIVRALQIILAVFLVTPYFYLLYKIYNQQFSAFGCFDECFNYTAGYFMLKGRHLYENIFFNHQPLMAYISYYIQKFFHPESIYHLVLYHRMFVLLFSFIFDIILVFRFRLVGIGFLLFYEITKFYFMGSLFLGESLVVQPLVYMLGVVILKFNKNKIYPIDIIISGVFTWFVVFTREPYIFSALFLYGLILWNRQILNVKFVSFFIFIILCLFIILSLNMNNYIYQVVVRNFYGIFKAEMQSNSIFGLGIFRIFFYPVFIFIDGRATFLRNILYGLSLVFLLSILFSFMKTRKFVTVFLVLLTLGISNMRMTPPGYMYYEAFHMLPWYGLFVASVFFFLHELYRNKKLQFLGYFLTLLLAITYIYAIVFPQSIFQQNIDREKQFFSNFNQYYIFGEAVRLLSSKNNTVFVDGGNDLVYWQTKLDSSYRFSIYSGPGTDKDIFGRARIDMFQNNPPDFYYYYLCSGKKYGFPELIKFQKNNYVAINYLDKPCLYVKRSIFTSISQSSWEKLNVLRFYPSSDSF